VEDERKTKKQLIEELNCLRFEKIEQAKVNSEKFTKAFLQNSIPTIITAIKDGRAVEVSDAFLRLVGRKRHEVIGYTAIEGGFLTEKQRAAFFNELNKNGRVENLEMEISTGDGLLRYGLFNSVMMSISNEKFFLTAVQDITDRKQMEEVLIKSREKYRKLSTAAHDAIITQDLEGIITYANPAAQNIAGGMDVIGMRFKDFIPPELGRKYDEMMDARRRGCTDDISYEWSIASPKDGSIHIFDVKSSVFTDKAKNSGILLIGRDITERKRAEEGLRLSEIKYRNLHQSMMDSFVSFDMAGNIKDYNQSYLDMLGYAPEEIVALTYKDITPEKWHIIEADIVEKQVLTKGYSHIYEKEYRRKDGTVFPVELRIVLMRDIEGTPISMWAIARDITDRKKVTEVLAKSAEKYRLIAESIIDCVVLVDEHGIIKYMANSIEIVGYDSEEMIDIQGLNITHPDDIERIQKLYREGVEEVWREITFAMRALHKDGHYISLEVRARTFTDPHGKVIGGVFVARNITQTQRGKLEQDISQAFELPFANINLTPREGEILNWIMQGKSTWDISNILNISESTVKFHIDKAMKKLGAVNRAHAVAIAMRNDLLD